MLCERATGTTVAALFGGLVVFSVPPFQRAFAWEKDSIDAFLDDVERCYLKRRDDRSEAHFFGSIVTGPLEVSGTVRPHREVLDGQQRLAMFALFIAALSRDYATLARECDPGDRETAEALTSRAKQMQLRYIVSEELDFMEVREVFSLSLNHADDSFFKLLLRGEAPAAEIDSHRRLEAANRTIRDFLREKLEAAHEMTEQRDVLNRLYRCLVDDWELVHIEAGNARQANQIFRVLNNRGVPVSACDLLRAATLEACHRNLENTEFEELRNAWAEMTSLTNPHPDEALEITRKARFPMSEPVSRTSADFEAAYFPELRDGEPLANQGARDLLITVKKLRDDFLSIKRLTVGELVPRQDGEFSAVEKSLFQSLLGELNQHWLLPILLSSLKSRSLRRDDHSRLFLDLCLFAFRYHVVCNGPTTPFEHRMRSTIERLNSGDRFRFGDFEEDLRDLIADHANQENFDRGLNDLSYTKDKKGVRFLLAMTEFTAAWYQDGAQGRPVFRAPDQGIDLSQITLEHISAQNPDDVDIEMRPLMHTVGNLTLLGEEENIRARNRNFMNKRDILNASNLRLNRELAELEEWSAEKVTDRQNEIIQQAMRVFSLDHTQQ